MVLKIAVTGANGMLGRHLVDEINNRGHECIPISRKDIDFNYFKASDWKIPCDAIIHAAAAVPSPGRPLESSVIERVNIQASYELAKYSSQLNIPFIFISGSTVYADSSAEEISEDAVKTKLPATDYGASKWAAERLIASLDHPRLILIRPTSIYGAGLHQKKLIMSWLRKASQGETIYVAGPSQDSVNLIHATDVARACLDALFSESWGPFNIAGPCQISMADLAHGCVEAVSRGNVVLNDSSLDRPATKRYDLDSSKARLKFKYKPLIDLKTGLELTLKSLEI